MYVSIITITFSQMANIKYTTVNNIKFDVWLTVHRNSVWIRKTN